MKINTSVNLRHKLTQVIVLILLAIIWGSSFILMKRGLESFSSVQVGAMRIFFSFLFLLPFAVKHLKEISKQNIKPLLIVGFFGNFFPALLYTEAQTHVSSSLAGMLNSMVPVFALIYGVIVYKMKTNTGTVIGVTLGFLGAAGLILLGDGSEIKTDNIIYGLLIVLATVFYAVSLNIIKFKLQDLSGKAITAIVFMFVGPVAGIYLIQTDFAPALVTPNFTENLIYIILLALFSSAVAVSLFYALIEYADPIFAASVTYMIPIIAIFWGLADGEIITWAQILLMTVILFGVYLIRKHEIENSKNDR